MNKELTNNRINKYNKGSPVHCDCGQVIAYMKNGKLMLYCKKCKRQIPFVIAPEPRARATED